MNTNTVMFGQDVAVLAANMKYAARNRETVVIGSGLFGPAELMAGALALSAASELLAALELLHMHCRALSAEYRNGLGDTDALYTQVDAAIAKATASAP